MAYKVVLLGDAGVGKSKLYSQFIWGEYIEDNRPTIGVDFGVRRFNFGSRQVCLQVWDTAGQERFQAMIVRSYLKDAHGVILVYDITNRQSFSNVLSWKRKIDLCTSLEPGVTSVLVGNKSDSEESREVQQEEGLQLADTHSMLFMESSARNGTNVEQVFRILVGEIDRQQMNTPPPVSVPCQARKCSYMSDGGVTSLTLSEERALYRDSKKGCCS